MNHPLYKHDSVVPEEVIYDMLYRLVKVLVINVNNPQISKGEIIDKTLLGDVDVKADLGHAPCRDRTILLGKVFKVPEKKMSLFDLVKEAEEYHSFRKQLIV